MTEKRFVYYEHKGADYILDTPNESLDFIEMLGDCLEAEEIVDLLNCLNDENEQLKHNNKMMSMKMSEVSTKYRLLKEFSDDTNPNEAVKTVLHELLMITEEYR